MAATNELTISLPPSVLAQTNSLAQQLNVSPGRLFEMAIENFSQNYLKQRPLASFNQSMENPHDSHKNIESPDHKPQAVIPANAELRSIYQGDIFWIQAQDPNETELGHHPHPYVVVQDNLFNHSRIHTVVVCALTTNLKQANAPGNVLLGVGEANLPKQSVVVVSKISTVNKSQLGEYIGSLNQSRVDQVLAGMRFLQLSFFAG